MSSKITSLFLMTLLVSACVPQSTTQQIRYVDNSCTAFKPIITHGNDPDVMDVRTVRAINAHNDTWEKLCGEQTK